LQKVAGLDLTGTQSRGKMEAHREPMSWRPVVNP